MEHRGRGSLGEVETGQDQIAPALEEIEMEVFGLGESLAEGGVCQGAGEGGDRGVDEAWGILVVEQSEIGRSVAAGTAGHARAKEKDPGVTVCPRVEHFLRVDLGLTTLLFETPGAVTGFGVDPAGQGFTGLGLEPPHRREAAFVVGEVAVGVVGGQVDLASQRLDEVGAFRLVDERIPPLRHRQMWGDAPDLVAGKAILRHEFLVRPRPVADLVGLVRDLHKASVFAITLHERGEVGALRCLLMWVTPAVLSVFAVWRQHRPVGRVHRLQDELQAPRGIGSDCRIHAAKVEEVFLVSSLALSLSHLEGLVGPHDLEPGAGDEFRLARARFVFAESGGKGRFAAGFPVVTAGKGADADEKLVLLPGLPRRVEVPGDGEIANKTGAAGTVFPAIEGEQVTAESFDADLEEMLLSRLDRPLADEVIVPVPDREGGPFVVCGIDRDGETEGVPRRAGAAPFVGPVLRNEGKPTSAEAMLRHHLIQPGHARFGKGRIEG